MAPKTKHDWLAERAKIVRSSQGFALVPAAASLGLNADEAWLDNPYREIGIAVSGDNQAGSPNLATLTAQVEQYKARAEKERSRRLVEQRNKLSEERKRQDAEFEAEDEKQRRAIAETQNAQAQQEQTRAERMADEQARRRQVAEAQVEAQKSKRLKAEQEADEALSIAKSASARARKIDAENQDLGMNKKIQNELEEKARLLEVLDIEAQELPELSPAKKSHQPSAVSTLDLVGTSRLVRVAGHPRNTLALRLGIALPEHASRIDLTVLEDLGRDRYRVSFKHHNLTGVAVLGFDTERQKLFAKTFYHERSDWFDAENKVIGMSEAGLKDRSDITVDQFVEYHKQIVLTLG